MSDDGRQLATLRALLEAHLTDLGVSADHLSIVPVDTTQVALVIVMPEEANANALLIKHQDEFGSYESVDIDKKGLVYLGGGDSDDPVLWLGPIRSKDATTPLLRIDDVNGNTIFEVRENGSVHIKTGGSVIADL